MSIFFVFYKLLLERENMHVFKRFYLLLAIGASLVIPTLVFTEYVVVEPVAYEEVPQPLVTNYDYVEVPEALEKDVLDIEPILWTIYFTGLIFFGLKFLKSLLQIIQRIRKNPKQKSSIFTQVLLKENFPPHTFFKYIFLNKKKLESNKIPKEVLIHEETHARQKHSLDVVFIEFLQVILWFNPLVYFFKKAIKLNHEFLADQAVLNKAIDQTTYQNTLLSFLSPDSEKKYHSKMANAINYSSIKKRFTVMKTKTSKRAVFIRSLLVVPLLAALFFGFTQTELIPVENTQNNSSIQDLNIEINNDGSIEFNGNSKTLDQISKETAIILENLNTYQIRNYVFATILYSENQLSLIEKVEAELRAVGVENFQHTSKRTAEILEQEGFQPSKFNGKTIEEAREIQKDEFFQEMLANEKDINAVELISIEIKNGNEIWYQSKPVKFEELVENINSNLKDVDDKTAILVQIYSYGKLRSEFVHKLRTEIEKIGAKQIQVYSEEYIMREDQYQDSVQIKPSTLQLRANQMTIESSYPTILVNINKKGQLLIVDELVPNENLEDFLSKLHSRLTAKLEVKRVNSTIHIDVESPEPIINKVYKTLKKYGDVNIFPIENETQGNSETQDGATKEQLKEYNDLAKKYHTMLSKSKSIQIKMKEVERLEYIYSLMNEKQKANAEDFPDFPEPPPLPSAPNAPKAPPALDNIIDLVKKDATFYLDEKEISSDKAIDFVKQNDDCISIDVRTKYGEKPKVKLFIDGSSNKMNYLKTLNAVNSEIKRINDYPAGYLDLSEGDRNSFDLAYNNLSNQFMKLSDQEKKEVRMMPPPAPDYNKYVNVNGQIVKK